MLGSRMNTRQAGVEAKFMHDVGLVKVVPAASDIIVPTLAGALHNRHLNMCNEQSKIAQKSIAPGFAGVWSWETPEPSNIQG